MRKRNSISESVPLLGQVVYSLAGQSRAILVSAGRGRCAGAVWLGILTE
jgi:hypothetical protein